MSYLHTLGALLLSPLLLGLINRVKAFYAGRQGPPLLQPYHDLVRLLRKGAVYSPTTTWIFWMGPVLTLAGLLGGLFLVPLGPTAAPLSFAGDMLFLIGLLALGRAATVLAALDTGSAFEGMGASREVAFSALIEPALVLSLGGLAVLTQQTSLSGIYAGLDQQAWLRGGPTLLMLGFSLLVVVLTENARLPVDDPNTHLELTMIHEVMVLDHSGPDLALIHYGQALKFWVLGSLLVGLVPWHSGWAPADLVWHFGLLALLAVGVGVIESGRARLRLNRIPQLLVTAGAIAVVVVVILLGGPRP